MSRNIEDIFGGVAVSTRQTPDIYTAVGGETFVTADHDFVNAVLIINGAVQTPGEQYGIDGRKFDLSQPLTQGDTVQILLNTAWSPKEVEGQYTQVVQFRSVGGETSYTPNFSFSSALLFFGDRPLLPGIDYTVNNGKIVYTSQLAADKQAYFIFNGGKGDLAFYKKLDEANADKADLLQRILNVYPVSFPVDSETAMLQLDAKAGDNAVRSDQSRVYYLATTPASDINNWKPFVELNQSVVTVNGRVGDVIVAERGANADITSLTALSGPLRLGGDASNDYDAVTLKQLRAATGGSTGASLNGVMNNFLGAVEWWNGTRALIPAGHVASDGQTLNRADYPDIWNAINTGVLVSVSESSWQSTPANRAMYSTGDGSTTFRMPDLNGVQTNSIASLFLRGNAGTTSAIAQHGDTGTAKLSAAPNMTGVFSVSPDGANVALMNNQTGVFNSTGSLIAVAQIANGSGAKNRTVATDFDASRANAAYGRDSATEVRPSSAVGIWIIRVNGKFSAAGTNFNVITGDTAVPANGTVVYGGDIRSVYQVAGADRTVARMRSKEVIGGSKSVSIALADGTGELLIGSDGNLTLSSTLQMNGNDITGINQLSFSSKAYAGQSAKNMGFLGTATRCLIPISTTQAIQILNLAVVTAVNSSGEGTITYPNGFANAPQVVFMNGNGNAGGSFIVSMINNPKTSGFDYRLRNADGTAAAAGGNVQLNYIAMGLIAL